MKTLFTLLFLIIFLFSNSQTVSTKKWSKLFTNTNLPKGVKLQKSQNNLDITNYNGKYYVAIRTAPSHFASKKTEIYVFSSIDFSHWDLESKIQMKSDLREPRFAVYHDTLFFYFFKAGSNMFRFEPQSLYVSTKANNQDFTQAESCDLNGYVPWRIRERKDTLYLSAYYGKGLYSNSHRGDLRLFQSTNGKKWVPISTQTQVNVKHAEEGEFIFDKKGDLWATIRLESVGGMLAHTKCNTLSEWTTKTIKDKYDSALLFEYLDQIYLISRRNLDGIVDKAPKWLPGGLRRMINLLRYWVTEKRTSIFKLNQETFDLEHLIDFPSTGDNAFPGIVSDGKDGFYLLNYSSDIEGRAKNWISGQLGSTYIYWTHIQIK